MRDSYFDNVRFILMAMVLTGHMIGPLTSQSASTNALYIFIYFFHMPLFVFVTGYFSKKIDDLDYSKKIISKLVIPYVIFETLYSITIYLLFEPEKLSITYFSPYYSLWFLFSVAIWKLILPHFIKVKNALIVSIVLAVMVGYASDAAVFFSLSRTVVLFPFFLAGYYIEKKHLHILLSRKAQIISAAILALSYVAVYLYGQGIPKSLLLHSVGYSNVGLHEWYAGFYRALTFVAAIILSGALLSLVPRKKLPLISDMGTRTLYPYLLHVFVVLYFDKIDFHKVIDTPFEKIIFVTCCILFTMFLSTKFIRRIFRFIVEPRVDWIFKKQ